MTITGTPIHSTHLKLKHHILRSATPGSLHLHIMTSELVDGDHVSDVSEVPNDRTKLTRPQAWNLYISHAFSTWNARGYEFAVVSVEFMDPNVAQ